MAVRKVSINAKLKECEAAWLNVLVLGNLNWVYMFVLECSWWCAYWPFKVLYLLKKKKKKVNWNVNGTMSVLSDIAQNPGFKVVVCYCDIN